MKSKVLVVLMFTLADILTVASFPLSAAEPTAAFSRLRPSPSPTPSGGDLRQIQSDLRQHIDDEIESRFEKSEADLIDHGKRIEESGELVLAASHTWIEVVSLLFVVSFALAIGEYRGIQKAKVEARRAGKDASEATVRASEAVTRATKAAADAEEAVGRIRAAESQVVEPAKHRMQELQQSISSALDDVQAYFAGIQDVENPGIFGEPSELPPAEHIARMEEADVVILTALRVGAISRDAAAPVFTKLGKYWNYLENYPRAIARFQRAIELDGHSWEAYLGMGLSYNGLAARPGISEAVQGRTLEQAEKLLNIAKSIGPDSNPRTHNALGWVAYVKRDFGAAIDCYKAAIESDIKQERTSTYRYNLSAVYAKTGRFQEACDEFAKVANIDRSWEGAETDGDFANLREDTSPLGQLFNSLVTKAKAEEKAKPIGENTPATTTKIDPS
jgi:tetratricopeptide (TPR) repeat protein